MLYNILLLLSTFCLQVLIFSNFCHDKISQRQFNNIGSTSINTFIKPRSFLGNCVKLKLTRKRYFSKPQLTQLTQIASIFYTLWFTHAKDDGTNFAVILSSHC